MPPAEWVGHHGTHAQLYVPTPRAGDRNASIDAIVVPTVRNPRYLDSSIAVGQILGCRVLALCSDTTAANDAAERAATHFPGFTRFTALSITNLDLPGFETSALLASRNLQRETDTSLKRNAGLAIAAMTGWARIAFLDDDMVVRRPKNIRTAAARLGKLAAVGLQNDGFPDNSVVCHALRAVGTPQDTFIGAGALAVASGREASFFPTIYNEDWFFLLGADELKPTSVAGTVTQAPFNPYEDPERARSEEFGDCMGEGIFALLDDKRHIHDADRAPYWARFLAHRHEMINYIITRIPELPLAQPAKDQMILALRAALNRLAQISPQLCVEYLELWRRDRERWNKFLHGLSSFNDDDAGLAAAVDCIGLTPVTNPQRQKSVALPNHRRVVLNRVSQTPGGSERTLPDKGSASDESALPQVNKNSAANPAGPSIDSPLFRDHS